MTKLIPMRPLTNLEQNFINSIISSAEEAMRNGNFDRNNATYKITITQEFVDGLIDIQVDGITIAD